MEIKEIENNGRNSKKIKRRKAEYKVLDYSEAVNVDVDYNMSEHSSIVSNRSNMSNRSNVSNNSNVSNVCNASNVSEREFLDDPELANYNNIQYLKARYLHLQSRNKF